MRKIVGAGLVGLLIVTAGLGTCCVVVAAAGGSTPSSGALAGGHEPQDPGTGGPAVPPAWEQLEQAAAATCPGLPWAVLAAIGRVESDSGRSSAPGVHSGANTAGAEGPMQFEPATFEEYAIVGPGGVTPPSPYDPVDAVYTAARMLCADGGGTAQTLYQAVWDYDHAGWYVDVVLVLATSLTADPALGSTPASAVGFAAQQLGVPYLWGGTGDGGFDCSGLVQAAYAAAGVSIPRVAQDQFDAGPVLAPTASVEPGDLVFFGSSAMDVSHVGIFVGDGDMIDAPDTGTVVRVQSTPVKPGVQWGSDVVIGVTRPWE